MHVCRHYSLLIICHYHIYVYVPPSDNYLALNRTTGFKWLGNKSQELKQAGITVLFAYEEALGYCVGDIVVDKDGISAAVVFAEMASEYAEKGKQIPSNHVTTLLISATSPI